MDIIERAYKPQHKADKIKSIYMQHYDDIVRLQNMKVHYRLIVRRNGRWKVFTVFIETGLKVKFLVNVFPTEKRNAKEILGWRRFNSR